MAKRAEAIDGAGSWLVARELYERGETAFVDELRKITTAQKLADFAPRWFDDASARPAPRRLLCEYLDRPLNVYGHEGLVKRLFKRAELAGDDDLMGRFLVAFDRLVRRKIHGRNVYRTEKARDQAHAESLRSQWLAEGFTTVSVSDNQWGRDLWAFGSRRVESLVTPRNVMPRGAPVANKNPYSGRVTFEAGPVADRREPTTRDAPIAEPARLAFERFRLFTGHTRGHLRRRAWRYFRKLGTQDSDRYVAAMAAALRLYRDADDR